MPKVEFVRSSASDDDNVAANPARLLNLYAVPVADEGRTRYALKSVLGQDETDNIGANAIRAMGRADDKNWLVGGSSLYEVSSAGLTTNRGSVADDANTTVAGSYGVTTVVSGGNYYAYDGALSQPTGKTFTSVGSHCYVGGYTVLTEFDGRRFQWSSVGDAKTLDALDFQSADKVDDDILRGVEYRGNLLVFCETSTEVWAIDASATDTAQRFFHTDTTNTGLKSFNLLVRFDDALFFVGNDNRAYIYGQGVVSDGSVETSIAKSTPTHCFYYEDEGAKHCVIRFSDRPAWVFDLTTGLWHERSENAGHQRWRALASIRNGSSWIVGNADGQLMTLARKNQDINGPLYRRAIARTLYLGDRRMSVANVEIVGRMGDHMLNDQTEFGLAVGDGFILLVEPGFGLAVGSTDGTERNAELEFYDSVDGARTWRGPSSRSMGQSGDYEQRMTWNNRGQAQQYTIRVDCSEPADITLYADGFLRAA